MNGDTEQSIEEKRERDALAMAEFFYSLYKDKKRKEQIDEELPSNN